MKKTLLLACSFLVLTPITSFAAEIVSSGAQGKAQEKVVETVTEEVEDQVEGAAGVTVPAAGVSGKLDGQALPPAKGLLQSPQLSSPAPVTAPTPATSNTTPLQASASEPVEATSDASASPIVTVRDSSSATMQSSDNHEHSKWAYTGPHAASKWGDIDAAYEACKIGLKQSPININAFARDAALPQIQLSYAAAPLKIINNGHTVQVNVPEGSTITVGDQVYKLLQYHFHTPSEHYIGGVAYPMEAHFVHKNAAGELGVFGVMMKVGNANGVIQSIWSNIPQTEGQEVDVSDVNINATDLFPLDKAYYTYDGSLTTPPCTEGVHWHVLKNPIEISQEQLVAFQNLFPLNARIVQPANERIVKGN